MTPVTRPSQKCTVVGPEKAAMAFVMAARPPDFSMTSMRTVTPQTIMMTNQGIVLMAALLSATLKSIMNPARTNPTVPTLEAIRSIHFGKYAFMPGRAGTTTSTIRMTMQATVNHCCFVKGSGFGAIVLMSTVLPLCCIIHFQPPKMRKPGMTAMPCAMMELK